MDVKKGKRKLAKLSCLVGIKIVCLYVYFNIILKTMYQTLKCLLLEVERRKSYIVYVI